MTKRIDMFKLNTRYGVHLLKKRVSPIISSIRNNLKLFRLTIEGNYAILTEKVVRLHSNLLVKVILKRRMKIKKLEAKLHNLDYMAWEIAKGV